MRYLSVCSGIEAATVAWHPLGWKPLAFSEIEKFPRTVLAHHYPDVPCHGDFTVLRDQPWIVDADILVGGTPCQAFSVAGLRNSLADDRGNLTLEFVRLANAIDDLRSADGRDPATIVWENVPGVLSVKDNAFGCFLAALVGNDAPLVPTGGKWTNAGLVVGPSRSAAWRILDAQYFGVAQRRRRVFVVASARDGFDPAEVLFEREGVRRDTPPRRETRQGTARGVEGGATFRWQNENDGIVADPVAASLRAKGTTTDERSVGAYVAQSVVQEVAGTLGAGDGNRGWRNDLDQGAFIPVSFSIMPMNSGKDYKAREVEVAQPLMTSPVGGNQGGDFVVQPVAFHPTQDPIWSDDGSTHTMGTGNRNGHATVAVAFDLRGREGGSQLEGPHDTANLRAASGGSSRSYVAAMSIGADCYNGDLTGDIAMTLKAAGGEGNPAINLPTLVTNMAVRRLTPRECERLQGFPDDYTLLGEKTPDGPRYKALGNSMAVPVMRWIGERINRVNK